MVQAYSLEVTIKMEVNRNFKPLPIIASIVAVAWVIIVLMFADFSNAGFYFWGGFCFGVFAFIVGICAMIYYTKKVSISTVEVSTVPFYFSYLYMAVSTAVNTIFIRLESEGALNKILVVINIFIIVAYIFVIVYSNNFMSRVVELEATVTQKTVNKQDCVREIGTLLAIAKGNPNYNELLSLSEMVQYSSNTTQLNSEIIELQFIGKLNEIQQLLQQSANEDAVKAKIAEAKSVWQSRNAIR